MTPDDPLPALRAEVDQAVAMAPITAGAARGLFAAFKAEGFTESQSLYLVAVQLTGSPGEAP